MKKKPPPNLETIVGGWITIPKQIATALYRLATGDSNYIMGEMFGVAACTSVKTSKRFVKNLLIATIPLHLKWPIGKKLINVKLGFKNLTFYNIEM